MRAVERVLRGGVAHVRDLRGEAVGVRLGGRVVVEVAHHGRCRGRARERGRDGDRVGRHVRDERPLHLTADRDRDDRALREVDAVARLHVELRRARARRDGGAVGCVLRPERVTQEQARRERRERCASDELRRRRRGLEHERRRELRRDLKTLHGLDRIEAAHAHVGDVEHLTHGAIGDDGLRDDGAGHRVGERSRGRDAERGLLAEVHRLLADDDVSLCH